MNQLHEANRRGWDARSDSYSRGADGLWQRCHLDPALALADRELHWLGTVANQRVAVLGSGDNLVAFALAGLGARVTSVDISANQLAVARERATQLGLRLEFVRADVCDLAELAANSFDLVYTGGHIAIWVADLRQFYAQATRILTPAGRLLVSEYHPFRRLWKADTTELELAADYFHRGPYTYTGPTGPQHEFQWTVSDYITAVIAAGCKVVAVEEFGTGSDGDWETAPVRELPRTLLVVGEKR